ncbi:uracil-DNA glycosylase family protein [Frigidibacter sp. SD6-1]|uniref:uracil-DNA glycosylase family protein n=1 Tax=Frigidibacter sp. SD6-1 TaxID=3032581 RepID=UPI0024DFAD8D|nr:uracil-DNA glycosylase family protein [Frigidibacter sp. SD6-1]
MTAARSVTEEIPTCRLCVDRFAATATAHVPRPVVWLSRSARILIAGQAPGARVHASGKPFDDPSGARLRDWLGLDEATFWDRSRVAFLPMAFCFPGYDAKGADLPPPPICARTWRAPLMADLTQVRLTFLIGGHAQRWHLGPQAVAGGVTATVARWRDHVPRLFPLPHPSWRNSGWLKRNPWFGAELLPRARAAVAEVLADG